MGAQGVAVLDFGAFPGVPFIAQDVTGQTSIPANALVEVWINPIDSADHSAGEHILDPPRVVAGTVVAGTGFTIYGINRDFGEAPVYGKWNVAWVWDSGSAGTSPSRILLTGNTSLFVRSGGSDSNNGLTAGSPFATIQHAADVWAANYDFGGQNATIDIGAGTFNGVNLVDAFTGGGNLKIVGAGSGSTTIQSTGSIPCIQIQSNQTTNIFVGSCLLNDANGWSNISIIGSAYVCPADNDLKFGSGTASHIACVAPGAHFLNVEPDGVTIHNYTINLAAAQHFNALGPGTRIRIFGTVTLATGTQAYTVFAQASEGGLIKTNGATFTVLGTATGQRYNSSLNAVINTNGGGANYFPGNAVGATSTGGQYA